MNIIDVQHVTKRFSNHVALNDVSLSVPQGCVFGLLGPNGAGKTTLIRILMRISFPDEGEIFFKGHPLQSSDTYDMGYLPEERGLYKKMKTGEQAIYLAQLKGLEKNVAYKRLRAKFEQFGIMDWWNRPVEELSKGMQQKVQFITTILHKPSFLILDEPFSGFAKILLVLSHPNYKESIANKTIVEKIKTLIPDIEIDHIDSLYPDEKIDVKAEQEKLLRNDTIIFQFPMYWHTRPYLLSKWFEVVYEPGFAYAYEGEGSKLKGKKVIISMTMENEEKFHTGDIALEHIVSPFKSTLKFTEQKYGGFLITGGLPMNIKNMPDLLKEKTKELEEHAEKLAKMAKN